MSAYTHPEAYDIIHTPGTAKEVTGLERIARRFDAKGPWLEPMTGTGRHLRVASRRGFRCIGLDLDEGMIQYARRRAPDVDFRIADVTDFTLGVRAGFAFCLINSIRHLPDDRSMLAHLESMAKAMTPRSVYVVGISLASYATDTESEDVWTATRGSLRVTQVVNYDRPRRRRESVWSHLVLETSTRTTHLDERYVLRTWDSDQWQRLVDRSPFDVEAIVDEQGHDVVMHDGLYGLFVLRKGEAD